MPNEPLYTLPEPPSDDEKANNVLKAFEPLAKMGDQSELDKEIDAAAEVLYNELVDSAADSMCMDRVTELMFPDAEEPESDSELDDAGMDQYDQSYDAVMYRLGQKLMSEYAPKSE